MQIPSIGYDAGMTRKIIHCDADCFFAAVEMRDDPSLRHRPMAVGGSPERRGVISTCNYEARRHGIRSAMASRTALALCPDLVIVPHRFEQYREAARGMRAIFDDYSDQVETLSLDEAYLDVSTSSHCDASATRMAMAIRQRIARDIGITVSAGVARTKFLAKIASEWRKPDGLYVITPAMEEAFIPALPVTAIPGVGKVTASRLEQLGITHCRDLNTLAIDDLSRHFGLFGRRLHDFARGIDGRPVTPHRARKSLGVEHTFARDLPSPDACRLPLETLFEELCQRLAREHRPGPVVRLFLKIKFADFTTTSLEAAAQSPRLSTFRQLLDTGFQRGNKAVRLLGVGVRFDAAAPADGMVQLPLFAPTQGP
ncbi:MAG: DNA polymerase IV [Porticoccaceae bacterium]|nr:DNA polymerase IV [Porticoccaceae bacterium]